jgi:hypothetical protein
MGKTCYICERELHGTGEKDHFPIPQSLGGTMTMPICLSCHDDKDRLPLFKWDAGVAYTSLAGLWAKANRDERLMLAKVFHVASQQSATIVAMGANAHPAHRRKLSRR